MGRQRWFWRDKAPVLAVVALPVAGMMMGGTAVWAYLSPRPVSRVPAGERRGGHARAPRLDGGK
ncbi:MAG: hypothetical protein H5U04_06530 [Firmicutes bacterium]|nr:hypothetical protein [Bacillota bacterium]